MADKYTRADLIGIYPATFGLLGQDTTGNPIVWENAYRCGDCQEEWTDDWSCQCDDNCPNCGTSVSPETSDWIGPIDAQSIAMWEALADK